jgi:hypothetical protein
VVAFVAGPWSASDLLACQGIAAVAEIAAAVASWPSSEDAEYAAGFEMWKT